MWKEMIWSAFPDAEFSPPARTEEVDQIERELGQPVPMDLRSLLMESNGVLGEWSIDIVWPAERVVKDNKNFRTHEGFSELYQPFDGLMFFGSNAGGDQFAYVVNAPEEGVFVWEHESDERRKVADDLADYLQK